MIAGHPFRQHTVDHLYVFKLCKWAEDHLWKRILCHSWWYRFLIHSTCKASELWIKNSSKKNSALPFTVSWMVTSQKLYPCSNPQNPRMWPYLEKSLCRYNSVKDIEVRRSCWIIWVDPKSKAMCPYWRHIGDRHNEMSVKKRGRLVCCGHKPRKPATTGGWKRLWMDSPSEPLQGVWPWP